MTTTAAPNAAPGAVPKGPSPSWTDDDLLPCPNTLHRLQRRLELSIMMGTRAMSDSCHQIQKSAHAAGIKHALVHVDIDDLSPIFHLLTCH